MVVGNRNSVVCLVSEESAVIDESRYEEENLVFSSHGALMVILSDADSEVA